MRLNGKVPVAAAKADLDRDELTLDGEVVCLKRHLYLMMNKPPSVLSASRDQKQKTVLDLVPERFRCGGLFPAGRLDKDACGFVIITDDGEFAHRILSPKNHVPKTYLVRVDGPVTGEMVRSFESGIMLKDETLCRPASLTVVEPGDRALCRVVITQGMYHQIKRMFNSVGRNVLFLKRDAIGALELDDKLLPGQCREMTEDELALLTAKQQFF